MDDGDVCGAAGLADQLNDQVIEAINARRIPPAFQEDLQARANELVNTVNCPPPTVDEEGGDDEEQKPKKDKKKKQEEQKEGESDDELVPTEPLPTVPEDDQ